MSSTTPAGGALQGESLGEEKEDREEGEGKEGGEGLAYRY